jgi:GNAT superfamily N-acetyltransferase
MRIPGPDDRNKNATRLMSIDHRSVNIRIADLSQSTDQRAVVDLLNHYAHHPFGLGKALSNEVQAALVPGLREQPGSLVFLADIGESPVGLAICFVGFSTFRARQLINVHDLVVHESCRSRGVGRALLQSVVAEARRRNCCGVTLEVRRDNSTARKLYSDLGFSGLETPLPYDCQLFGKLDLMPAE